MKVVADHGTAKNFPGCRLIVGESGLGNSGVSKLPGAKLLLAWLHALRLWSAGLRSREPGPFVTIGSTHGFVLAWLQWIGRPLKRPRTHVMFDFLLERKRRGVKGRFDRLKMKLFSEAVDAAVVWGEADVEIYAREYDLPRDKLRFHPFHITLDQYSFDIRDDGFIFAGGNHGRDYNTLIAALGAVQYPVFIATQVEAVKRLADPYPHITVQGVTHEEFRRRMAASTLVVEAHPREFFRTAGHQTFLNAMWMGKPFVMADLKSAAGYFEIGKHWLVVDAGDVEGLRSAVELLLGDRDLAARVARAGQEEVRKPAYRTLNCMQDIYNLALGIESGKRGLDREAFRISIY